MSTNVGSIHYDLGLNTSKFDRAAAGIKGKISKIGSGLKVLAKGAAIGGAAIAAVGAIGVKAWTDQENAIAQLNAVLKSTKGVAGVTSKAAQDLASSLQSVTTYADEVILGGENVLLTFTKIGKDIFPQATETMLDMSQALGQDLKSSAIQLGKALQDPILGVTALRRVGVNFSSDQQEVIKKLVETGRTAEAQRMILKELNTEFGGSARAAAKTFGGQMTQLKNVFGDFMEEIGKGIAKRIQPLIQGLLDWVDSMGGVEGVTKKVTDNISSMAREAKRLYDGFVAYVTPGIKRFIDIAKQAWDIIFSMLAPSIKALADTFKDRLWPQLKEIWDTIEPGFTNALKVLGVLVGVTVIVALWLFINVLNVAISILGGVIRVVSNVIKWFGNLVGVVINAVKEIANWFSKLPQKVKEIVDKVISFIKGIPGRIGSVASGIVSAILSPFVTAKNRVLGTFDAIVSGFRSMKNKITGDGAGIASWAQTINEKTAGGASSWLKAHATGTLNAPGGWSMVGERGPELVNLPAGSKVYPASRTRQMMQGDANTSIYGNVYIGSQQDADYRFSRINRSQQTLSMGLASGGV